MQSPIARTVYDLLHEIAEKTPNAPFAFIGGEEITYRQMADRAAAVAGRLQENGITRGDVIGLLCNNRIEWLDICFGAAGVGMIAGLLVFMKGMNDGIFGDNGNQPTEYVADDSIGDRRPYRFCEDKNGTQIAQRTVCEAKHGQKIPCRL